MDTAIHRINAHKLEISVGGQGYVYYESLAPVTILNEIQSEGGHK